MKRIFIITSQLNFVDVISYKFMITKSGHKLAYVLTIALILFLSLGLWVIIHHNIQLPILSEQRGYQSKRTLEKQPFYAEKYLNKQLKQVIKTGRYFDIHYFVDDDHVKQDPKIVLKSKPKTEADQHEERPLLQITMTEQQLETQLARLQYKRKDFIIKLNKASKKQNYINRMSDLADKSLQIAWFISKQPNNMIYRQALYYHYDTNYHIGDHGKQLPLCIAMVGKNNARVIIDMYESIRRQNYTNYHIAQVDDNSDDGTIDIILKYLNKYPQFRDKITLVVQPYERNSVYNRVYVNQVLCAQDDIIVDMDTDDYLIGTQVFQLINTNYQQGNLYKGQYYDLWTFHTNFLTVGPKSLLNGQISEEIISKHLFRYQQRYRTSHIRSYLRKIFMKLDKNDFVDELNIKKGQYYAENPDILTQLSMFELSAPKHSKIIDQFVYFYTGSPSKSQYSRKYAEYVNVQARSLPIYLPLESLADQVKRGNALPHVSRKTQVENIKVTLSNVKKLGIETYEKAVKQYKE